LKNQNISTTSWLKVQPELPFYFFTPINSNLRLEFDNYIKLSEVFEKTLLGPNSHRDHFAVAFTREEASERIADFMNPSLSDDELRQKYSLDDNRGFRKTYQSKCLYTINTII
jgi:hypothetical protein